MRPDADRLSVIGARRFVAVDHGWCQRTNGSRDTRTGLHVSTTSPDRTARQPFSSPSWHCVITNGRRPIKHAGWRHSLAVRRDILCGCSRRRVTGMDIQETPLLLNATVQIKRGWYYACVGFWCNTNNRHGMKISLHSAGQSICFQFGLYNTNDYHPHTYSHTHAHCTRRPIWRHAISP